jgi:uncharacterized protein (TIGR04255 family)
MTDALPSFERPPLVETVLGVQFDPIASLGSAHLGAFWKAVASTWRVLDEVAPLPQFAEISTHRPSWKTPSLKVALPPPPSQRLRFVDHNDQGMIQIQNGWFVYNWRCLEKGGAYPRFTNVHDAFCANLALFRDFLKREGLGDIKPNLWEVTYVNHIDAGQAWSSPKDWASVIPGLLPPARAPGAAKRRTRRNRYPCSPARSQRTNKTSQQCSMGRPRARV